MSKATLQKTGVNKWLINLLLITVLLTLWTFFRTDASEVDLVESIDKCTTLAANSPSKKPKKITAMGDESGVIAWQSLKRKPLNDNIKDPFKVHSWLVVPPVKKIKSQVVGAPAPVAPPVPFIYIGKFEEDINNVQFFFQANDKLYSTIKGQNIGQEWRLDGEDASNLQLTYLPLNLPQVLSKATRTTIPAEVAMAAEMNL